MNKTTTLFPGDLARVCFDKIKQFMPASYWIVDGDVVFVYAVLADGHETDLINILVPSGRVGQIHVSYLRGLQP